MAVKSRKRSGFVIYHILETMHLQQGMQSSELGYVKGVPFVNRRYAKGVPLFQKYHIKGSGIAPRGGTSPYKTFLSTHLPGYGPGQKKKPPSISTKGNLPILT